MALPRPRIAAEPLTFSFSGLKTAVALQIKKHPEMLTDPKAQADLAASFQEAVVDSLVSRAWLALEQTGLDRLVVCGGVAANGHLRRVLQERAAAAGTELFLPPLNLCGDNAAMVAALGYHLLARRASAWTWTPTSSPGADSSAHRETCSGAAYIEKRPEISRGLNFFF